MVSGGHLYRCQPCSYSHTAIYLMVMLHFLPTDLIFQLMLSLKSPSDVFIRTNFTCSDLEG